MRWGYRIVMSESIRELIADLAHVEDAIRRASVATHTGSASSNVKNGVPRDDLIALALRQDEIIRALRRHKGRSETRTDHGGAGPTKPLERQNRAWVRPTTAGRFAR